jgi:hypothetical protein
MNVVTLGFPFSTDVMQIKATTNFVSPPEFFVLVASADFVVSSEVGSKGASAS